MEIEKKNDLRMYEIAPTNATTKIKGGVFGKGRILLGRSETCDLMVNSESISAIHAVMEIHVDKAIIYDMNSTNGTFVNDDRIVKKDIGIGDTFRLAGIEFTFKNYHANESLPPILESLEPESGAASVKTPPPLPEIPVIKESKSLPKSAPTVSGSVPSVVYPLASDPKAEFSEYIFEDKEELFPIFKYETSKQAVEVIILFKGNIFSVDYLEESNKTYYISGINTGPGVEFPFLGKTEKFPFVDANRGQVTVHLVPGFGVFHLSDKNKDTSHVGSSINLQGQDLIRFHNNDLQIFVRNVASPPKVAHAPILKRDPDFQRYLVFLLFMVSLVAVGFNVIEVPEDEKKEELAPERLATILYKQPLTVSKNKAVEKTEKAPKVIQKAPPKVAVKKEVPKEAQPEVKKPDVMTTKDQNKKPDPGTQKAPEKKIVKQGTPNSTPTNKISANKPAASNNTKLATAQSPTAFSQVALKTTGHVEVYKSADFKTSINSLVAKGGSLSGVQTKSASGAGGELTGAATGISSGSGNVKTADIATSQGSLVGATTGVLGESKGAGGLSAKKAIFTAGIPSETIVLGSMDPDVIRRILLDHLPQFRYCYQKELERSGAEMGGVIKLDFTIGASGHVTQAGVEGDSKLPPDVKRCVVGVLRGIPFPAPMGGGVVEVKQPMNFYPKKI